MQVEKDQQYLEKTLEYKQLIDELMANSPDEEKVKKLMQGLGIKYIADPVMRLNTILQSLHK